MNIDDFPRRWLDNVGLKVFSLNIRNNLIPNIWCLCKLDMDPVVVSVDDQQVSFMFSVNDVSFGISAIYASVNYVKRRQLWTSLNSLQHQFQVPWCFIGDFNAIIGANEHRGAFPPARIPMDDFLQWTDNNNLIHIPTRGVEFTWANGREGKNYTQKRLDRAICNLSWINMSTTISCSTLVKHKSDHCPLLLDFHNHELSFASQFRFFRMWSMHNGCKDLIQNSWNTSVVGCPMFVLCKKLKILKEKLKEWNKSTFGDIHNNVKVSEQNLQNIQHQIDLNGHNDSLMQQEKLAHISLDSALDLEECFWKEKARVNWHLEGDRNTGYFHRIAKIRNTTKLINAIRIDDDIVTEPQQIADHIVHYYQNLFYSNNVVLQENNLVEDVIPNLISEETNRLLTMLPSSSEIHNAIFSMNSQSAPGPDGFGAYFFQTYWDIVKDDVIKAVLQFFTLGWIMPNMNSNTVALIPKVHNADRVEQFRPIAMANFKFKIITKIIADRLAQVLPSLISKEQRGFVNGRQLKDCVCREIS
ncbi:hypothetical protein P8452_21136 [Trifolium repens]|nr:hypothetical protein P8452_21136 [Trifolium repens]